MGGEETASAAELAAPTEMAGTADAETQSAYAWGLADEDDTPTQRLTAGRITGAAVAVAAALVVGAAVVGFVYLRDRDAASGEGPSAVATPTSTVVAMPPPPAPPAPPPVTITTVVVHEQMPPTTARPTLSPVAAPTLDDSYYDQQFLAKLQANGWAIWSPSELTRWGHQVCTGLRRGEDPVALTNRVAAATGAATADMAMTSAVQLVNASVQTYPRCEYSG